MAPENQQRGDLAQMAVYSQPAVVAVGEPNSRLGAGFVDQATGDDQQFISPDHAETDYETAPSDNELDSEDNLPPLPLGRPGDGPVAAATAPQCNQSYPSMFLTTSNVEFGQTSTLTSSI